MSYAQNDQDRWLMSLFPPGYAGFMVDVGAYDGVTHSNSLLLEQSRWTALCIEPNPMLIPKLKQNRIFVEGCAIDSEPSDGAPFYVHEQNVEAYSSLRPTKNHAIWHPEPGARFAKITVPVKTLEDCLAKWEFPRLDVLCVDVEGTELEVLKSLDLAKWRPKVVLAEAWDEGSLDSYLTPFGYRRAIRLLVDDGYVLDEEAA